MNNILDYKGFRFFQSSYDNDEKGTILSVNHDEAGTFMTYAGYILLFGGMFVTLFWKGTRFSILKQQLSAIADKKKVLTIIVLLAAIHPAMSQSKMIDQQHADKFGYLPVQNFDGRIEPANTLALEILRKLYRHDNFYKMDANQFLLDITTNPVEWLTVPLIKVNARGGEALLKQTKANKDGYTSVINLLVFDKSEEAHFLLEEEYKTSFAKKAADQDNYDKEVIELNDKMEVAQGVLNGTYLRILPIAGDMNNTWTAVNVLGSPKTPAEEMVFAYYEAVKSGDWVKADASLQAIKQYQLTVAKNIMPAEAKINWEVRYNQWNLFLKLMIFYSIVGGFLLIMSFVRLFSKAKLVRSIINTLIASLIIAALLQTMGIAVRWYISGHAPWSNGYEAVMFISLIGLAAGLFLYKNSNSFIPAGGALIAVIMMGFAHGGAQMNPQITPLVPVLKSYWLMVHVAIITASYGFFGLCALLGMFVMLMNIVNNKKRKALIEPSIRELTIVNELSMTIGLFLLTVGTFLGGVWANESWGRYWSWDPKETWAFISVIVYAFVLHVRLIPGMQGKLFYNFLSLIAFSTVIMTYFGVNYYLSGLHSYAKGDPMPIPAWIYITIVVVTIVSVAAFIRKKKLSK
jgi:cytochrome c-type biogenesis protein CcsB